MATGPQRSRAPPKNLDDYVEKLPPSANHTPIAPNQESSTIHPIANYLSYDNFSNSHMYIF